MIMRGHSTETGDETEGGWGTRKLRQAGKEKKRQPRKTTQDRAHSENESTSRKSIARREPCSGERWKALVQKPMGVAEKAGNRGATKGRNKSKMNKK